MPIQMSNGDILCAEHRNVMSMEPMHIPIISALKLEQGAAVVISMNNISSSIGRIEEFKTAFFREFAHKTDAVECRMCIQF